ncbi:MAG: dihydroorotate dehydrogenase [Treponema sp.]|nr:dihydroorotate dehydrogenase [Treponema sp.]
MYKDCEGVPLPVFCKGVVSACTEVEGAKPAGSVYNLKVTVIDDKKTSGKDEQILPVPGQFYMLHAVRSSTLLGRPISIYHAEKTADGKVELQFLILVKGKGTQELCSLRNGDEINLLGPCGNGFCLDSSNTKKICIVGGGIGVAPVAGFAEELPAKSYDFYASFKSGSYGLENLKADKLIITTDDGSVGVHGMLPAALTEQALRDGNYSAVYACGPTPMLKYVKMVSEACGIVCWLSMESHMACGTGCCLGCTIDTTEGKKRCCKEGPVFDSRILFPETSDSVKAPARTPSTPGSGKADLSVTIAGVKFQNPVIGCSGTFGFGSEYASVIDVNKLGGICSKGLTLEPRQGNDGMRVWETPSGLMNSIGLQNPGIPHFIENELPYMMSLKPVAIANLSGSSLQTYVEGAKLLQKTNVPMIELNISCPNVSAGGAAFGMTCAAASEVTAAVRAVTDKPLIVKLTPQSLELNAVALACIKAGADGISLCNSFQGIAIDIERGVPVFDKIKAGLGGPAIRPIAVRLVYELVQAINTLPVEQRVPVIAIGGIATWQDAVEFIMAGASAVEVGTATFANPFAMIEIIDGLAAFMKRKGYDSIEDMRGLIQ